MTKPMVLPTFWLEIPKTSITYLLLSICNIHYQNEVRNDHSLISALVMSPSLKTLSFGYLCFERISIVLKCLISARGEFWESVFLKHKSIQSIRRVLEARVLWTVWTSASEKRFPGILPVLKLHSLIPASRSNLQIKKNNWKKKKN